MTDDEFEANAPEAETENVTALRCRHTAGGLGLLAEEAALDAAALEAGKLAAAALGVAVAPTLSMALAQRVGG